ncbi:MAG TPA: hypothetical protein VFD92_28735 [Candidatus Binatia bacterium]|nr:hypothetical protein [Candidatus Binatia bacterium]
MRAELPGWMRSRAGAAPILLVAPHGGISPRDLLEPPAGGSARSNDLYTADVAAALAERLDASLLANVALDRNQIDLNRLSEVERAAPWFLHAIGEHVERLLALHDQIEIVFVHGWHIVQPKCDIGLGRSLATPQAAAAAARALTVPARYVDDRLEPLRALCRAAGIAAAYGERWPAAHANNVMQVFRQTSTRAFAGVAGALAAWARAGRIAATQLELGAPIRWPGRMRDAFVDAFVSACGGESGGVATPSGGHGPSGRAADAASSGGSLASLGARTVQGHDPDAGASGLGIAAAIGPMPDGRLGARLLFFPGGRRLVLFTGEERVPEGRRVGGLTIDDRAGGLALRFRGPALLAPDASRHFRSEVEQARARVVDVRADLQLDTSAGHEFGPLAGAVEIDGARFDVATHGFTTPALARATPPSDGSSTRVTASFGRDLGLALTVRSPGGAVEGQRFAGGERAEVRARPADGAAVATAASDASAPFVVRLGGEALACRPACHLAWLRPLAGGRWARVTFGVASFALADRGGGSGLYEHVVPVPCAARAEEGTAAAAAGEEDEDAP